MMEMIQDSTTRLEAIDLPEEWQLLDVGNPWTSLMPEWTQDGGRTGGGYVGRGVYVGLVSEPQATNGVAELAERLQRRTFALATGVLRLFREAAPRRYDPGYDVVCKQVIRSATSTGANYRAVCRARSDREFYAKLCIVVEECDETVYWIAVALNTDLPIDREAARAFLAECKELAGVFAKSKATMKKRLDRRSRPPSQHQAPH